MIPEPETLLTRQQVADALTAAGFPICKTTLAAKACRGGGPPFRRWGNKPLYRWADAIKWAQSRLQKPLCLTKGADIG